MPVEQDYYFTFGYGHKHGPGGYAIFHGTYETARDQMVAAFGNQWAFQYTSATKAGVGVFNLNEIKPE